MKLSCNIKNWQHVIGRVGFHGFDDKANLEKLDTTLASNIRVEGGESNEILVSSDNTDCQLNIKFTNNSQGNRVLIGPNCRLRGQININGSNNEINFIGDAAGVCFLRAEVNNDNNFIYVSRGFSSNGTHFSVAGNCNIIVGEDSMFANDIYLRTSDMHSVIDLDTKKAINCNSEGCSTIFIAPHVWIGQGAMILKDVTIGCGSVIGAKALVTQDIPSKSLCVGIPAKVKRSNISWTRQLHPKKFNIEYVDRLLSNYVESSSKECS